MSGQNGQLSNKQQEKEALQEVGETATRGVLDYASGGQWEKVRNTPVVGKVAKKAEEKGGKKLSKSPAGKKLGKFAKGLKDSGALDKVNQGMNTVGGAMGGKNSQVPAPGQANGKINTKPNVKPNNMSADNAPNPEAIKKADSDSLPKQNFAKKGVPNQNDNGSVPFSNRSDGSNRKGLNDIFNRKKNNGDSGSSSLFGNKKNSLFSFDSQKGESSLSGVANFVVKKMAKKIMLPFIIILSFLLLISVLALVYNNDNDLSAVDEEERGEKGDASEYYANGDPDLKDFYERVVKISDEYKSNGKSINTMYLTATYHVINQSGDNLEPDDVTDSMLREWSDGMLGNSTVYNENTYKDYLKNTLFPSYGFSEKKSERMANEVFEYINNYLETRNRKKTCTTTTGSSCGYSFNGVHGLNVAPFTLSNLQVRLMSSSFCKGTDNVALKEDLVPFEKYVLGVTYGEIGEAFNTEVEKVHMIAARSFALARPYSMNGASGVKYINDGGNQIVQLRACVADQVFCNTDLGCSKDTAPGDQYGVVYSGMNHRYVYKQPLSNYPNATLKSSWEQTMGMVGVDKDGKVVEMGYYTGNGNKDDWVWKRWAEQGMDYVQIIMSAYPEIKEIKKTSCDDTKAETGSAFLEIAATLWKKVVNGTYSYGNSSIPPTGPTIDCSSYVDWVLSEYGYSEFLGAQHVTQFFVTTDLNAKFGWTEIPVAAGENVTNKLLPGDILVRDPGNNNGHMNIIVEVKSDGSVWGYDCGDASNWARSNNGAPIQISTSFVQNDSRPGKIIRVSNVSGSDCKTAESGEWMTWRQYAPAPWANIRLGNSSATIGGYGCFVTSIAIQIARSGVPTNLSEFNPGTFVQELNKYGSFDGNGNFQGTNNIPKIVPSFQTAATAINIYGMSKSEKISTIQKYIDQGYYVLLRVKYNTGQHWVAVTGTTADGIQMVDPGSDATMVWDKYPVSESSTINLYKIG